ncbi:MULTISPECIES: RrF2 family transcriptional regulator [unclassified Rhodococcus (in: high G+C Gram-positive bacteria)]|uniref:RrF2 family transcriptional regulator n=1 Tax=unclassified Rhodococcus (in: high G+C Gram-positive bacteria) TaxID=192944 RepID=UPI000E0B765A|nr:MULTISPECIES: Rrf2 family transcriptional regulator [unclassified Rhodococcus (in: high G+C Gram-positive bacteria)]QKT10438.1 Rrf2 family transcriptional regulator [Rhodococcus sp. W8901]RDI35557.1 BadM/Rrf2 family transcriptional regulator [Rhodococcus sp. AG1013]
MQLTQFTDLGLRIVMRLAAEQPASDAPSTRAVAEQLAVSYTHATKVVARLSELGVVTTRRGRGGGLAITELGRTASVGWLTRQLEGDGEVVTCEGDKPCPLRRGCRLRSALRDAQEAFYTALDAMTVRDLTPSVPATVLPTPAVPAVVEP